VNAYVNFVFKNEAFLKKYIKKMLTERAYLRFLKIRSDGATLLSLSDNVDYIP